MSQDNNQIIDNAVADASAYEIIRKRLESQSATLKEATQALNARRMEEFGGVEMTSLGRTRVRTENNCIARDIVQIGDRLLFGYNVFIGLKKETHIEDVFALFRLSDAGKEFELEPLTLDNTFLYDARFKSDFEELYRYYKEARLVKLSQKNGKLLAGFQISERTNDVRVFRWAISPDAKLDYIDNRGERDYEAPNQFDFEWIEANRNNFVHGKHPHVNIADTIFVETLNGNLTIKIENNTEDGLGIFSESVDEPNQSLDDAQIRYAQIGNLTLLGVLPYKEEKTRYYVYNQLTETVHRIDEVGSACVLLPEDQGIIFPGGYYLETGDTKSFPKEVTGLSFERTIRSPNGEDVLYVFYQREIGRFALFSYNLITKTLQNPIYSCGYALYGDGRLIVFSAEEEPTRVHLMQLWQSPYISTEYASEQPESTSELGKIGNSELVRGVSDLYEVSALVDSQEVSMRHYEELNQTIRRTFDSHYWLLNDEHKNIAEALGEISETSELVIDEYEKVQSIQQQSAKALQETKAQHRKLISKINSATWETAEQFIATIGEVRRLRGHIATVKTYRYINLDELSALDTELVEKETELGEQTTVFLAADNALASYIEHANDYQTQITNAETNAEIKPVLASIDETTSQLDLLSELVSTLKIDDTTVRTNIVDVISEVYAKLNKTKALGIKRQQGLGSEEAIAQFAAQFKLFSQSVTNALSMADTPDKCDEQLTKLLVQLDELESQFSEYDQFLADILEKRDEVYESFEAHKQSLTEARQRRAQTLVDSAGRVLKNIEKRSLKISEQDALNTYFASDALVLKIGELVERLNELDAAVSAEDVQARFLAIKEQAIRALRDKSDIFEDGGKVIKLGSKHKFSVNQQEADLTILPRNDELFFHIVGTDYFERVSDPELEGTKEFWPITLESESDQVYRSEYLAYLFYQACKLEQDELNLTVLKEASNDLDMVTKLIRDFSTPLYKHGYQKGIHDADAAVILSALLPIMEAADLLAFGPHARSLAMIFWSHFSQSSAQAKQRQQQWHAQAVSALQLQRLFADDSAVTQTAASIANHLYEFCQAHRFDFSDNTIQHAAYYLVEQLASSETQFAQSKYAKELATKFQAKTSGEIQTQLETSLRQLKDQPRAKYQLVESWLQALVVKSDLPKLARYIPEAAANLTTSLKFLPSSVELETQVDSLLGDHPRVDNQTLPLSLDDYLTRMTQHHQQTIPQYQDYLEQRKGALDRERQQLKLESFKARPLSSFVRNRLVSESYLPIIGDNLAKQIGTVGEGKRTDLMGLLMMISPPGYGKTTLMEYVANRLGLIFMKINCPALGHDVTSLDPDQAPNSTARQELEKINLAFEMGNNVMLYLDDIQHTHPEFLQKYISLCDGTRRVEGVWRGETKTYDMRGKKFCVVMAGNPYTESGEVFKVPDMLANRADIYNLGDILGDMKEQFALSYIENALTSNAVLAPLATRDMQDVYRFVDMVNGKNVAPTELSHQYSGTEINEICRVLEKLFEIQSLILKVNQQYIASAAQDDRYRTEPPFKLQGSYRNMNKMAEKVSAVMNAEELNQLIDDHYLGESQLLTKGTEENLLKLAELRGTLTAKQEARWTAIKDEYQRANALGGSDADGSTKIANQVLRLTEIAQELSDGFTQATNSARKQEQESLEQQRTETQTAQKQQKEQLESLEKTLVGIGTALQNQTAPKVEIVNQPSKTVEQSLAVLSQALEYSIRPLLVSMEKKLDIDLRTLDRIQELTNKINELRSASLIESEAPIKRKTKKKSTKKKED